LTTKAEYIAKIPEIAWRQTLPNPKCTALIVIDMQEYFRSMASGIIKTLASVISVCRKSGIPVIYTQHGHEDPKIDGGMLGQWWGELIIRKTPQWNFISEIRPESGDITIHKNRYSAFFNTDLQNKLQKLGINDLIITGVMTNLCCETTARDAFVRDYRVFFLADGTATNHEFYQICTLRNLAVGFAYILMCDEIINLVD